MSMAACGAGDNFIPLVRNSCVNNSASVIKTHHNKAKKRKMGDKNVRSVEIYGDRKLIPRMKNIINETSFRDVEYIMEELRNKHPEYRRKQISVLKRSVEMGLKKIPIQKLEDKSFSDEDNYTFENEVSHNNMNQTIGQLYSERKQNNEENKAKKLKKNDNEKAEQQIKAVLAKQVKLREQFLMKPRVTYDDFGGIDSVILEIEKLLLHLQFPELGNFSSFQAPSGILICGPPGVGKSKLVEAVTNELQIPCLRCTATELVAGISGESEGKIRDLFNLAKSMQPCLLFIDEIDAITPKREQASREMERRIVTQLGNCLDSLGGQSESRVMVIGATSRPEAIDLSLRRSDRFEIEIGLAIPDEKARVEILKVLCRNFKLSDNFDFETLAYKTPGFVGADLKGLIRTASRNTLYRALEIDNEKNDLKTHRTQFKPKLNATLNDAEFVSQITIEMSDFEEALKSVQPLSKHEGFAKVPDITWNDVGALSNVREELQLAILAGVKYREDVETLGLPTSVGILLCGPPGCGKTLLAKAIANESGINFLSVKGPELLNMYVGESERAVRAVFNRARDSKPCVIFFDEIDALCPKRTDSESNNVASRVVNQLLTEMDGLESRGCFMLGATNRPDIIDPAILRPGRFDKILFVDLPTSEDRFEILKTLTKNGTKPPCSTSVDFRSIANDPRVDGFTGADLHLLVREASEIALRQRITGELSRDAKMLITERHFESALAKVKPSVSSNEKRRYELMRNKYHCLNVG